MIIRAQRFRFRLEKLRRNDSNFGSKKKSLEPVIKYKKSSINFFPEIFVSFFEIVHVYYFIEKVISSKHMRKIFTIYT
jgi:hypothetical protein